MSSENSPAELRLNCESRSSVIQRQLRYVWIPGRRRQLLVDCYELAYDCLNIAAFDLAEQHFRLAISLMANRKPEASKQSLANFNVVAACHNLLGLRFLDEGRNGDAVVSFDTAISVRRELKRLFPDDRENEIYLGGALCNRGHASRDQDTLLAAKFYQQSLAVLRQPTKICECSYWDEARQSWWCEQLEALGDALGLQWPQLAPQFIDNASAALNSLPTNGESQS